MITWQLQRASPAAHVLPVLALSHSSPLQQAWVAEHSCPALEQVAPGTHAPLAAPAGTWQTLPGQQSEVPEQAPPALTQVAGGTQAPAAQTPLQQSLPDAHEA